MPARRPAALATVMAIAAVVAAGCFNAASPATNAGGISTQWIPVPNGKFLLQGAILQKYIEAGESTSPLGLPITNEQTGPNGGRYSEFEGGAIYWTPKTGAKIIAGGIRLAWEHQYGGAGGPLGYPTTDQQPIPGGSEQHFQHGTITDTNDQPHIQALP